MTIRGSSRIFVLRLRPLPRVDPIRALRGALKTLLRRHGLRCISLDDVSILGAGSGRQPKRADKLRKTQMDMSKYASSIFIKVDDLEHGPEKKVIIEVEEGKFEKPVLTFDDGSKFSLNGTNVGTLIRAFGKNNKDWINKKVELYVGTLRYNGVDNPSVLVRALETVPDAARTPPESKPLKSTKDDMDDTIPF
jgi:hypothetical protein